MSVAHASTCVTETESKVVVVVVVVVESILSLHSAVEEVTHFSSISVASVSFDTKYSHLKYIIYINE